MYTYTFITHITYIPIHTHMHEYIYLDTHICICIYIYIHTHTQQVPGAQRLRVPGEGAQAGYASKGPRPFKNMS